MAAQPLRGPFTVDAYQRLGELGVLGEDDRVELIGGQVVEMTPIGDPHAACVRRLIGLLGRRLGDAAVLDAQNPVVLGIRDAPQPDIVLLRPRADGYPRHPRAADILLLAEVADSSLPYDRDVKLPLYARSGIPEVWLVDLAAERIHVCREPVAGSYARVDAVGRGASVTPLHFPRLTVAVDEILG